MNVFTHHYQSIVLEDALLLGPTSKRLPKATKVFLSTKIHEDLGSALGVFNLLTTQKPALTKSKTNNLSLQLKKGQVVGCALCLRKKHIHMFLQTYIFEILPSAKNLSFLRLQKNSVHWHFSDVFDLESLANQYMYLQGVRSLDVVIHSKDAQAWFYQALRLPVKV